MNIGEQIAKYRKERHLTQEQLGEALGVTNRTVSKWESGVSSPGVDLIPPLASALGITLEQLFGVEQTRDNTDNMQKIKEAVSSALKESLPEILEDVFLDALEGAVDDALCLQLPKYLYTHNNKDEYSLLIIGRDKATVVRFYGEGRVFCMSRNPPKYAICVPAQCGETLVKGYESEESAAKDLERIYNAFTARLVKIEL